VPGIISSGIALRRCSYLFLRPTANSRSLLHRGRATRVRGLGERATISGTVSSAAYRTLRQLIERVGACSDHERFRSSRVACPARSRNHEPNRNTCHLQMAGARKRVCQIFIPAGPVFQFFWTSPNGNSATTDTIAGSVLTRSRTPAGDTAGAAKHRGTANKTSKESDKVVLGARGEDLVSKPGLRLPFNLSRRGRRVPAPKVSANLRMLCRFGWQAGFAKTLNDAPRRSPAQSKVNVLRRVSGNAQPMRCDPATASLHG